MEGDTAPLRSAAAHWSLSGDSQLLSVLQSLHQTIITKCQETNTQLDAMVGALDNASIDLQNVNNKFMALSNSQFVESRVYEDEVELADNNTKQDPPKPEAQSSVSSLKCGLQVLESLHEVVAIVDSDSEEEEHSLSPRRVLRPACARPRLPHVVGSQAWRDAAHAGLSSDTDSDEDTDKRASALEEYSDSDSNQHLASSSSLSSMTSHALPPPVTTHAPAGPDGHTDEQFPEPELEESPQPRKLYTVEKPIPAQIFPDEPPPLDRFESDSDDDIFAELHKQPYPHSNMGHNVVDDLFGSGPNEKNYKNDNDIGNIVTDTVARENSPLFSRPVEPQTKEAPTRETYTESIVKKPVGGISLFGSKGSESIGAAILKRNQRQSSSESEATDTPTKKPSIIEDLFTKPVKNVKKQPASARGEPVVKEAANDKTLFSDNIFDDIDDIFISNVVTITKSDKDENTLFDDLFEADKSDNDLFDDRIKNNNNTKPLNKDSEIKDKVKSIFDSDSEDDLFSDVKLKDNNPKANTKEHANDKNVNDNVTNTQYRDREISPELKESKMEIKVDQLKHQLSPNMFDDDDDDLFGDKIQTKQNSPSKTEVAVNINETQYSNDNQDVVRTEVTSNNEVKITEADSKVSRLENEKIEEKYVIDTKSNNIPNSEANNEIKVNESELDNEDIKESSAVMENNEHDITADVFNPKVPSLPDLDLIEEARTSKEEDIGRKVIVENHSKDIFVDIFSDLPPAFEKPMEPKKSKNVNALFDDDSDDEALFFKKDDVITDEKPDLEYKSDRFQIFHDEPPDIDVDFSQKSRNTSQIPDNLELPDEDNTVIIENLIQNNSKGDNSLPKIEPIEQEKITEDLLSENKQNLDDVISKSTSKCEQKTDILKLLESERDEDTFKANNIEEDIFSNPDKNDSNEETRKLDNNYTNKDDTDSSGSEKRPVGKLRPMAININVNTLLPGAVHKKSKSNEETDGQTASRTNEEHDQDFTEPETAKTVSFKGNPDSEVLDNKLSKERAKIQVKRRPSTRRARLEAVRKSGMDFGSDSTDNSSSFDEPVKEKQRNDKTSVPYKKLKDETKLNSEVNEANTVVKEVTSKVVYILNDEDIFEVPARTEAVGSNVADDSFNPISTKGNENNTNDNIPYYPSEDKKPSIVDTVSEKPVIKVDKTKKSLFDDMSDDDTELFKKPVNKSVFDSDSESELFCGKKDKVQRESGSRLEQKKLKETKVDQKVKERKLEKKVEKKVTKALFSDDSDEDLFGGKTKKLDFKETPKPKPSATKTSLTFEDPLSMLDDET